MQEIEMVPTITDLRGAQPYQLDTFAWMGGEMTEGTAPGSREVASWICAVMGAALILDFLDAHELQLSNA